MKDLQKNPISMQNLHLGKLPLREKQTQNSKVTYKYIKAWKEQKRLHVTLDCLINLMLFVSGNGLCDNRVRYASA